jgi:O-antigen ligase
VTRAERLLLALVVASILFAPIFLGGVGRVDTTWSGGTPTALDRFLAALGPYHVLAALAAATAATAFVVARDRLDAGEPPLVRLHPALLLPFGGLVLLGLLQLVPLPRPILGLLSPAAAEALQSLVPGDGAWRPLSVSPEGTRAALGGLGIGGAALIGALLVARRAAAARALLAAVVLAATGSALYGLYETHLAGDTVLGFRKPQGVGVSGFFVNRSHMAAAAGMALPAALAFAWACFSRSDGRRRVAAGAALLAAAAVLAAVIPLTHSRMGLASAAVGVVALGLLASGAARWPAWGRAALVVATLGLVAAGTKAALDRVPELEKRFALGTAGKGFFDIRFPAWRSTVELAARYPALGTGLGTYETAIHETQSPDNPDELVHAHSEPLEILAEGGILGFALAALLALAALGGGPRLAASGDPWSRAAGCACAAALVALLAGCATEFHLHIPALAIPAVVLAAIPAALAAGEPRTVPAGEARPRWSAAVAGAAALLACGAILDGARDSSLRTTAIRAERGGDADGWLVAARRAVEADPGDALARRSLAGALVAGTWIDAEAAARAGEALREADRAVDLEPFAAWSQWSRVLPLLAAGRSADAVAAVARARSRAGGIGHLHFASGKLLLVLARGSPELEGRALEAFRTAGECEPQYFTGAWTALQERGIPLRGRGILVPEKAWALATWAELLRGEGVHDEAYDTVVRLWRLDPSPENAERLLQYAGTADREEDARRVLGRGSPRGE